MLDWLVGIGEFGLILKFQFVGVFSLFNSFVFDEGIKDFGLVGSLEFDIG